MKYYDAVKVGSRIRAGRKTKKFTQAVMAEQLDFATVRQVRRIETGESSCTIDKLVEISQILEVSTDYLLFGEGLGTEENDMLEQFGQLLNRRDANECEYAYQVLRTVFDNMAMLHN
jgi:transcriptional regulator with XRE-family HTH domain